MIMQKSTRPHFYLFWVCVYAAILLTNMLFLSFDDDILWHYKLGEEVMTTLAVTTKDTFSWQEGLSWVNYEWLFDALIYLVIRYTDLIGFTLLYGLNAFLLLFGGAFFSKAKSRMLYVGCASLMYLFTPSNHGNRPGEFSIWLIVLAVYLFKSEVVVKKKCLWLFLLGILVANFHGGSFLTATVFGMILAILDWVWDIREKIWDWKEVLIRFLPIVAFLAGTVLNPAGVWMHYVSVRLPFMESTKMINEWQQTAFGYVNGFFFVLCILVFGYQVGKRGFERSLCKDIALFCAAAILGLTSGRGCIIYLFLWLIFGFRYFEEAVFDFLPWVKPFRMRPAAIVMVCFVLFFAPTCLAKYPTGLTFEEYALDGYASETAEKLKELEGEPVFNGYNEGNFLLFQGVKCFIDSRQSPYTKEFGNGSLDTFLEVIQGDMSLSSLENYFVEQGFTYVYSNEDFRLHWCFEESDAFEVYYENEETLEKIYKVVR